MSSEAPDAPDVPADEVEPVRIEDEMEQSYIDYAMSVIVGRALPDARDGLKPVQRRILYAMDEMGVTSRSGHRKSSSIVGDTMGNYHPHGDSAIYDALARMAQDFSLRYPLVDGQGNFGSVDGDPPAAMRYTEARMAPIAEELLADIDKDTVDFAPNYDDRLTEPAVLPAAIPNLLVNGASGIAVGMSTNIPPHNLGEVIDAAIHVIDHPGCSVAELLDTPDSDGYVKGPDFPTGAKIVNREGLWDAYTEGRGRLRVRAEMETEYDETGGDRIVVTELPYQQNKARRIERIADDVGEGKIEGIRDIRDESDRNGVRIVVECKRGANADVVRNQLLEHHLENTFSVISLALVDDQPRILNLKELLEAFVEHRREVVRRRSQFELDEAEDRAHILEGRLTALDNVERVVELVRDSEDRDAAMAGLREAYDLSEAQAEHIVRMQLGSLTSMEAGEIEAEYRDVQDEIERLETILNDESELLDVIKDELEAVKASYDDERRTGIVEDAGAVTREDLIAEEEVVVAVSEDDYVKRMSLSEFDPQHRGGKGIIGSRPKSGDRVSTVFTASTHDYLLCFTNQGQVYRLKVFELPEMGRTARGTSAVNIVDLDDGEEITAVVNTDDIGEGYFAMATRNGYVKRTEVSAFENVHSGGIRALTLESDDSLVDVEVTDDDGDLLVGTREGMTIRFSGADARPMGRSARGVNGIDLRDGDRVAGLVAAAADDDRHLLTVTKNGYGKRTPLSEYRRQSRYGKGLIDIKTDERNGPVCSINAVSEGDGLVIMSESGQIMRTHVGEVSTVGRNTKGVVVMRLDDDDRVAGVDVVPDEGRDDGLEADDETEAVGGSDGEAGPGDE
ncbi:DNA gyrase subunit A [Natronomonas moolapensis 8.8.11]|uniref:DNA gyrase subunit A n=1 Tax=Natronomonas moolapensis (strain DSM 18674 / CECT 7526 / JCM 14361 / 8.8.11) TaxID=268739 RepID=M1XKV1_NATM8|nr:DNA gyrase subunit A [Natronomonas moolapensis]CCQ36557.1 DNA gyrase subunit A [Natronomonas moolapensis 8.8.11]